MKLIVAILSLFVGATVVFGQESTAAERPNVPVFLAQAGRLEGTSSINDVDAVTPRPLTPGPGPNAVPGPRASGRAATDEGRNSSGVSLMELIERGGWAMIPLGFLSFLTVMLVIVFTFTFRRSAILTPHYMNTADVLLKKKDYLGLLAISSRHSEAIARVVQRTLDFVTKNPNASFDVIREIAETEGSSQAAALQHRPTYLADIGTIAPMVGLLGTVLGIIRSFGVLAEKVTESRDVLLAEGVSEALVATGGGLIVGIVAFTFYAIFRNKVQSLISDLEIASAHILGLIELNFNKKRDQARVALDEEF